MKIKTVIFDLDGTLAETVPLCLAALRNSVEPLLNRIPDDSELLATFGPDEYGSMLQLVPGREEEAMESFLRYYDEMHDICPGPFEGIKEILDSLSGKEVSLGMVTGKGIQTTNITLQKFGLDSFFQVIEVGSPHGPDKINGISRIIDRLGASKEDTIYVGDMPGDIVSSRKVGVRVASAAWSASTDPAKLEALNPDWIFYSVKEFGEWIIRVTG